jgi:hypothetical protein
MASRPGQCSNDPDDLSSNDDEYLMPEYVAEIKAGGSDHASGLLTAARQSLNSPSELPQNWGKINVNFNDYHSDPMEVSSTFWLPDITDWLGQQEETHSNFADLSNVARDVSSIILHRLGVEASFSIVQDVIWRGQSKTTGETLRVRVVVRQCT